MDATYDCCIKLVSFDGYKIHTLNRSLTEQSHSPTGTGTAAMGDSSAATTPSSADNLSQATGGSASEGNADQQESSDSVVEFRDSTSE